MPPKSWQHLIPKVYLKAFCDARRPEGHPEDRPFTPALWVFPTSLIGEPKRAAPQNVAAERHTYTLTEDDPNDPRLEAALSQLESAYASVIERLVPRAKVTPQDRLTLCLFIGALQARTRTMMDQRQTFFDEITGFA